MKPVIGFIGLGIMGIPMAKNIHKAGFPLVVYNRNPAKTEEFKALGVTVVDSPAQVGEQVEVIITMVTAAEDVKTVLFGEKGAIHKGTKTKLVIDMETIGPTAAKEIAAELEKNGIDFMDAPVTGSLPKAKTAELTIFAGSKPEIFETYKEVLEAMGTNIKYMGDIGKGQSIKLINNYLITHSFIGLANCLLLADAMGLDRKMFMDSIFDAPVISDFMRLKLPSMVSDEHPLLFTVENIIKDTELAQFEADKGNVEINNIQEYIDLYKQAKDMGLGKEDVSTIMRVFDKKK
jgi:3-hydroxyisobutyrate dehydrogenase